MPTYTYRCLACGLELTAVHSMAGPAREECTCGGRLRRVYDAPAVRIKGLGFARNDHLDLAVKSARRPGSQHLGDPPHSHGPGGHHGMTPTVVARIEGHSTDPSS
jgi:putative FmdB family regulatory protein